MKVNKNLLHEAIIAAIEALLETAHKAAQQAYDTATSGETVAENKYDTFGLEASYLAAGQSKRVQQYEQELTQFKEISCVDFDQEQAITIAALVEVSDQNDQQNLYFISPVCGGLKLNFEQIQITLITPSAPLGRVLLGHYLGDEVEVMIANNKQHYLITDLA